MSSLPSPSDKISSELELSLKGTGTEGTVDRLNEAAKRFVALCDSGVFMTCDRRGVNLKCKSLNHAQAVHSAIIDIAIAASPDL